MNLPTAFDDAFTTSDELPQDLVFGWEGIASRVQSAFAQEGLVVRLSFEASDEFGDELWQAHAGTAMCLATRVADSDLCRIVEAFGRLRLLGYTAEPDFGLTSSSGWDSVPEGEDGETRAVFWNSQAHEVFDAEGDLAGELHMQWVGEPKVIAAELAQTGLVVVIPESTHGTFILRPRTIWFDLGSDETREDVHNVAKELGWIAVEINAGDVRIEDVWMTSDGQNVIRYIESISSSGGGLLVTA